MPYIADGSEACNKSLAKRISEFIHSLPYSIKKKKLLSFSYGKSEDINSVLNNAFYALTLVADVDNNSKDELARGGSCTVPDNLSDLESYNKFYFFISMIGFIDRLIGDCRSTMDYQSHLLKTDENAKEIYKQNEDTLEMLAEKRLRIIAEFKNTQILDTSFSSCLFEECLKHIPMYNAIGDLYKEIANMTRGMELITEFANAYSTGYRASSCDIQVVFDEYDKLFEILYSYIDDKKNKSIEYSKK